MSKYKFDLVISSKRKIPLKKLNLGHIREFNTWSMYKGRSLANRVYKVIIDRFNTKEEAEEALVELSSNLDLSEFNLSIFMVDSQFK